MVRIAAQRSVAFVANVQRWVEVLVSKFIRNPVCPELLLSNGMPAISPAVDNSFPQPTSIGVRFIDFGPKPDCVIPPPIAKSFPLVLRTPSITLVLHKSVCLICATLQERQFAGALSL
jgi:hypothetical protein